MVLSRFIPPNPSIKWDALKCAPYVKRYATAVWFVRWLNGACNGRFVLFVSCIATLVSWGALWLDASNEMIGQRAEGLVTDKNIVFSAGGDNDYIVEYWFNLPSRKRVEAVRGVHKKLWNSLRVGGAFFVLYSV